MRIQNTILPAILLAGALLAAPAQAETVMNVNSTGVAIFNAKSINLADGSIVQVIDSKYIWTQIDGDMAGQSWGGFCYGLGRVTPEGAFTGEARCEDSMSAEDSYNTEYTETAEGGDWVVTGGKGKFKGATGSGHIVYTWGDTVFGDRLTMTSQGTIILP